MRFTFVLAAALPLLARFTSTFAHPIRLDSADLAERYTDDIDARDVSYDFTPEYDLRELYDYLEARAAKKKVTAAEQKARKAGVVAKVANNQKANAAKKAALIAKGPPNPPYGKPRSAAKQKPNKPGYRAAGRAAGHRDPKQPKTPKPNMQKGDPRSAKSAAKQAAANQKSRDRKAAGRAAHAPAKAAYKATTGLPGRKEVFTAPGGEKIKGKHVRGAVYQQHKDGKGKNAPKPFKNMEQGPVGAKTKPIPGMTGTGKEWPVTKNKGTGPGVFRAITKPEAGGATSFQGVVAHDSRKSSGDPGYNDHHQVHGVTPPPKAKKP